MVHSIPCRRLGRPARRPASPTNTSSESSPSVHAVTVICIRGMRTVLILISAPVARASGVTRLAGSPVTGSTVIVAPRASLLWKPRPALT